MSAARRLRAQSPAGHSPAPAHTASRRHRQTRPQPVGGYITYAQVSLAAAAAAQDPLARALHEEECKLWLMLAAQRRAIESVLERHRTDDEPAADP